MAIQQKRPHTRVRVLWKKETCSTRSAVCDEETPTDDGFGGSSLTVFLTHTKPEMEAVCIETESEPDNSCSILVR